jgi:SAM-dependent methyltransferase
MTLSNDGERMIPELSVAHIFWEHVYRYRFAARFAKGRVVLDVACGAGYGTAALRDAGATRAVGVDLNAGAVEHARTRYGVEAIVGSAEAIPMDDGCADLVVSMETIEHIQDPAAFLRECRRVLAPGGLLVVSTPNRAVYSAAGHHNPYHVSELTETEFSSLVGAEFEIAGWYDQCRTVGSWWKPSLMFADGSPWMSRRPGRAVRRVLQRILGPGYRFAPSDSDRADPVRAILREDRPLGGYVIPFAVRRRRFGESSRPQYFVAAARKAGGKH